MSATTVSTSNSNFRLILDALEDYAKQTGIDLAKNPFAESLQRCHSHDSVLQLLQDRAQAFKDYREGNRKLINWLSPVVKVIHGFSNILGEAAGLVSSSDVIRITWSTSAYVSFRCHSNPQS
jgi:fungal STAND N-terminal Goodbye domain